MIDITAEAAVQILASVQHAGGGEAYLRLAARVDGKGAIEYGMGLDERADGDLLAVSHGINVLISPGCAELLAGATLDYVEINPGERRFIFINPNDPSHKPPATGVSTRNGQGPLAAE